MGKPTICIGENKGADQLRSNCAFIFATRIVQFLYFLKPKFPAYSDLLSLYRPVCVGPVRKPHCWFSPEAAQLYTNLNIECNVREWFWTTAIDELMSYNWDPGHLPLYVRYIRRQVTLRGQRRHV